MTELARDLTRSELRREARAFQSSVIAVAGRAESRGKESAEKRHSELEICCNL